jgi:hypothetical protein
MGSPAARGGMGWNEIIESRVSSDKTLPDWSRDWSLF